MKKYYSIIFIYLLLFAACDPNKDINNDLDKNQAPYNEKIIYTMTATDYSTFSSIALKEALNNADSLGAKDIKTFLSFGLNRQISKFPKACNSFIATKFPALDSLSVVILKNDFSETRSLIAETNYHLMTTYDYNFFGPPVSTNQYISNSDMTKLYTYLQLLFPNAKKDQFAVLSYNYNNGVKTSFIDDIFIYSGVEGVKWYRSPNVGYALQSQDYISIGITDTLNMNFSSDMLPQNYLPAFLKNKFTYAFANETRLVSFKYKYSSSTPVQTYISKYTFNGSTWNEKYVNSDQFVRNRTAWFYDPTVYITFTSADYQWIVDYVRDKSEISGYYNVRYKNEEYWFGANAYRQNFDFKYVNRTGSYTNNSITYQKDPNGIYENKTSEELTKLFNDRIKEILIIYLESKYPTFQPVSTNGLQTYIAITYTIYTGSKPVMTAKFKCKSTGKFEVDSYTDVPAVPK